MKAKEQIQLEEMKSQGKLLLIASVLLLVISIGIICGFGYLGLNMILDAEKKEEEATDEYSKMSLLEQKLHEDELLEIIQEAEDHKRAGLDTIAFGGIVALLFFIIFIILIVLYYDNNKKVKNYMYQLAYNEEISETKESKGTVLVEGDSDTNQTSNFCPNCGTETRGKRFCSDCGERLC